MKIAVLDLGTNVFNLLIANFDNHEYTILKIVKVAAKLGEGGLDNGYLSPKAFLSAEEALKKLVMVIAAEDGVDGIFAVATSAIRESKNRDEFAEFINAKFGIKIDIISGDREAELIFKGVSESMMLYNETVLVLDIGGGSNEFIIARKGEILWKKSYPLGVARLKERFRPSDPVRMSEVDASIKLFEEELTEVWEECRKHNTTLLIGASGSFDTIRSILYFKDDNKSVPSRDIDLDKFEELYKYLLISNRDERLRIDGMSPLRSDFMVLAMVFIFTVLKNTGIKQLCQSSYSLKEGVMIEKFLKYLKT